MVTEITLAWTCWLYVCVEWLALSAVDVHMCIHDVSRDSGCQSSAQAKKQQKVSTLLYDTGASPSVGFLAVASKTAIIGSEKATTNICLRNTLLDDN